MSEIKAKRKLKDISFEQPGAHVALVSKGQGGPANGHDYALLLKARNTPEETETIRKAQAVQVTMELPDFLERFFYIWEEDAKFLASLMGWVEVEETAAEEKDEYMKYLEKRIGTIEIMKSLYESDDMSEVISELTADEFLKLRKDQALVEKAFRKQARLEKKALKNSGTATAAPKEGDTEAVAIAKESGSNQAKVDPSGTNNGEKSMDEVVELQKALDAQREELQKALETIQALKDAEKQAVIKSKTAQIVALVKDEKQAEVVTKAALALESDEDFTAFVEVIKAMSLQVEKSSLFQETGASTSDEPAEQDSPVARILKARLNK